MLADRRAIGASGRASHRRRTLLPVTGRRVRSFTRRARARSFPHGHRRPHPHGAGRLPSGGSSRCGQPLALHGSHRAGHGQRPDRGPELPHGAGPLLVRAAALAGDGRGRLRGGPSGIVAHAGAPGLWAGAAGWARLGALPERGPDAHGGPGAGPFLRARFDAAPGRGPGRGGTPTGQVAGSPRRRVAQQRQRQEPGGARVPELLPGGRGVGRAPFRACPARHLHGPRGGAGVHREHRGLPPRRRVGHRRHDHRRTHGSLPPAEALLQPRWRHLHAAPAAHGERLA